VARLYGCSRIPLIARSSRPGFVPADGYGETQRSLPATNGNGNGGNSNGNSNGTCGNGHNGHHRATATTATSGNTPRRGTAPVNGNGAWQCSDKQRRLLS
jgi:hypothetical protein